MTITSVIRQTSTGHWAIYCPRLDCEHYESGIRSEPVARYKASTHDAHHRRHR